MFKLLILSILVAYTFAAYTATSDLACMGGSTNNQCTHCFNMNASKKMKVRSLATNNCKTNMTDATKVTSAVYYSGTYKNAAVAANTDVWCATTSHFSIDNNASPKTYKCVTAWPAGITRVATCDQVTVTKAADATLSQRCNLCAKGKAPAAGAEWTSCTGTAMTNCDNQMGTNCYLCKANFALKATATAGCVAFTKDANCRQLATGDVACGMCKNSYYFNKTVCKLYAKILGSVLVLMISAFFY